MKASKLARIVWQSVNRNRQDFLFSSVGIIIGISTLLFFTSLGTGIKDTVLEGVSLQNFLGKSWTLRWMTKMIFVLGKLISW